MAFGLEYVNVTNLASPYVNVNVPNLGSALR